jgi:KUP system potassium uptake protein
MSLEVENPPGIETTKQLKRQDSLYGDAEKVSSFKHHGSEVCFPGNLVTVLQRCTVTDRKIFTTINLMITQGGWSRLLHLAFQSVGIIYGDVGTSPLYAISSTFPDGIKNHDDLLGVLSLILYTLILIPMVKYVFIVLYADDNGDGKLINQEISTCQPDTVTICLLFIRYFTLTATYCCSRWHVCSLLTYIAARQGKANTKPAG